MNKLSKVVLTPAIIVILAFLIVPVMACYGPHITSDISTTKININETVTVTGQVCPVAKNLTIRVCFTRPDYSWIDQWILTDNVTGKFSATQKLDMAGYWNIFPIYDHLSDRLFANVIDPTADPNAPPLEKPVWAAPRTNYSVVVVTAVSVSIAVVAVTVGTRKKTRKISSLRLFVQIAFVFLIFFGIFIDHKNLPWPAEQVAPHDVLLGTKEVGNILPDGLPAPIFGCYFPCGRTVTCPLWQVQAYIYPFWDAGRGWGVNYDTSGITRLAIVFGVIILASVLLGRFFCGWICPFGLYLDLVTRLRKAVKIKHRSFSDGFNKKFHQLSYVILALIIILSVVLGSQAIAGSQLVSGTEKGGFVYTYFSAPFCQVCPMKPLCVLAETSVDIMKPSWIFGPTTGQFLQLGFYVTSLNLFVLGIVTVAAFFFRRSWCRICPLGGLIALFNRFPPFKWVSGVRLEKVEEKCTKCGVCQRVCPTQVKEVYENKGGDVTSSQCLLCLRCVEMCPYDDCLKFKVAGKTVCKSRNWLE